MGESLLAGEARARARRCLRSRLGLERGVAGCAYDQGSGEELLRYGSGLAVLFM